MIPGAAEVRGWAISVRGYIVYLSSHFALPLKFPRHLYARLDVEDDGKW